MKNFIQNKYLRLLLTSLILVSLVYVIFPRTNPYPDSTKTPVINKPPLQKNIKHEPTPDSGGLNAPEANVNNKKKPVIAVEISEEEINKNIDNDSAAIKKEQVNNNEKQEIPANYPAGETVDDAWKTLALFIKYKPDSCDYDIFTDSGKIILKSIQNSISTLINHNDNSIYKDANYKTIVRGNYALIIPETDSQKINIPFLFCKTSQGWKFDVVHQKKLIRFDTEGNYGIEKVISPYSSIVRKLPAFENIDIPFEENYSYKISNDSQIAKNINNLENIYKSGKLTFDEALNLARLYIKISTGRKAIPLLQEVKKNIPEKPDVYKNLALAHVNCNYNYIDAKKEIKKYINLKPEDAFGQNFHAYLQIKTGQYGSARDLFEKILESNPQNCYTIAKLAQLKGEEYYNSTASETEKKLLFENYQAMLDKAKIQCKGQEYERFIWLIQWKHLQKL